MGCEPIFPVERGSAASRPLGQVGRRDASNTRQFGPRYSEIMSDNIAKRHAQGSAGPHRCPPSDPCARNCENAGPGGRAYRESTGDRPGSTRKRYRGRRSAERIRAMYRSTSPGRASAIAVSSGSVRAGGRSRRLYEWGILFLTLVV